MNEIGIYIKSDNTNALDYANDIYQGFNLKMSGLISSSNFFNDLSQLVISTSHQFILIIDPSTILPIDIIQRVNSLVVKANKEFGSDNWGIASPAGIDYLSSASTEFANIYSNWYIPSATPYPIIASSVWSGCILLNIDNIRRVDILREFNNIQSEVDPGLKLATLCYTKQLLSLIDSELFVRSKKLTEKLSADSITATSDDFASMFINHNVRCYQFSLSINYNFEYLNNPKHNTRVDYYKLIDETIDKAYNQLTRDLYYIVRTQLYRAKQLNRMLDSFLMAQLNSKTIRIHIILAVNFTSVKDINKIISDLRDQYNSLDIQHIIVPNSESQFPRVHSLAKGVAAVDNDDAFIAFLDDDDFLLPSAFSKLHFLINESHVSIFDAIVFHEEWRDESSLSAPLTSQYSSKYSADNYYLSIAGDNYTPINAIIYPARIIKKAIKDLKLLGNYSEDYAIQLAILAKNDVRNFPIPIAGIGLHGANTVLEKQRHIWDISYTTFISEIVNQKLISSWVSKYVAKVNQDIPHDVLMQTYHEYKAFRQGLIWRVLQIYRKLKRALSIFPPN